MPGRTITGLMTPEARAEEERIIAASKGNINVQSIFDIMEEDKEQVRKKQAGQEQAGRGQRRRLRQKEGGTVRSCQRAVCVHQSPLDCFPLLTAFL